MEIKSLAVETVIASLCYVLAFFLTFEALMPVQNRFFPDFYSSASLLFLPHGVRVLTAWLLGWRSIIALLPGVFFTYYYLAGEKVFMASRLMGISIAVLTAPIVFYLLAKVLRDLHPAAHRTPCWPCVMGAGVIAAVAGGILTNLAFGSPVLDYFAFFIGDVAGLFFLMLFLMLLFRYGRRAGIR
ncbi:hypothetical protein N6L24_13095 [Cognatishimia sp. SS12]|uniref:hypothetical protein n=1 Tax=Cognatishimia sp. SS12 TaxID=2979465 RepID=UPI00232CFC45|nr:hypothetical protein [Cognatishimia sp. SS12]MDC0739217.1 hypothetical protein [Cognatishimia sp. SS12]